MGPEADASNISKADSCQIGRGLFSHMQFVQSLLGSSDPGGEKKVVLSTLKVLQSKHARKMSHERGKK